MILQLNQTEFIDTLKPIDLSIELKAKGQSIKAWGQGDPTIEPVRDDNFVGSVAEGGVVNFKNIFFNPHAHLTHTECCVNITKELHSDNDSITRYFFNALLVTIEPKNINNDSIITLEQIHDLHLDENTEAIVIRTLPNNEYKKSCTYTGTNPPYIDRKVAQFLIDKGVEHLLVDLPSVDKEQDDGILAFHRAFWNVPANPNKTRTITEFIYVPSNVEDGLYILNLQMSAFSNDASPSRPILYTREKRKP